MSWRKVNWSDPRIQAEDFVGGSRLRLAFPDGTLILGKLSVEPMAAYRQNDEVLMARVMTPYSGDTWINVHLADVEVWDPASIEAAR